MVMTDTIADMLTRIRNANKMRHETVTMPASKAKSAILKVLLDEGFVKGYKDETKDGKTQTVVSLKYGENNERVIKGLKRISKPGLKVYAQASELPKVLNGLGIAIISTSQGVMADKQARRLGIGGEVVAYIW